MGEGGGYCPCVNCLMSPHARQSEPRSARADKICAPHFFCACWVWVHECVRVLVREGCGIRFFPSRLFLLSPFFCKFDFHIVVVCCLSTIISIASWGGGRERGREEANSKLNIASLASNSISFSQPEYSTRSISDLPRPTVAISSPPRARTRPTSSASSTPATPLEITSPLKSSRTGS